MEVRSFGGGGRIAECERILTERLAGRQGRVILLPIPTSRDNKYITQSGVLVEDILPLIDEDTRLVGYNIPNTLTRFCDEVGAAYYDGAADEEFLIANAELTARGTLGFLLTHTDRDMSELRIGVVGYGRIGVRLIRLLLLFGAEIITFTRRRSVAMELCEMGVSAAIVGEEFDWSRLDILINTAPARQIGERELPDSLPVIDLASGKIFEPSDRLTKLASIPDQMYPKTAGRLYAEAAINRLWGENI